MFELANRWTDAIKVIGTGNAAGVITAGAALNTFSQRPDILFWIKGGGIIFLIGVFAFAVAFALISSSVFFYDEMLHATREKNVERINHFAKASTRTMNGANNSAYVGVLAFFLGCIAGLVVLIRF